MFRYLLSYIRPIEITAPGRIVVIIRGLRFEAATRYEILIQIQAKVRSYLQIMSQDLVNVGYSLPAGNIHGKMNPHLSLLKNDSKTLMALEQYLINCDACDKPV